MIDDKYILIPKTNLENMHWINPLNESVSFYGAYFIKENKDYTRLPISKEKYLMAASSKCYNLGKCSSGVQLHFITNSSSLVLHAIVPNTAGLSGMAWTGQAGFDCYVGKTYDDLKFIDTSRCYPISAEYEYTLFKDFGNEDKLVVINFPLYNKVEGLHLAIDDGSYVKEPHLGFGEKYRIVIYGTSITQGGYASRPGLAYTNILSRRLKAEFFNFGFSGNAFGEKEYAAVLASMENISMYIINYEANGGTNGKLEATLEEFIKTIREKHKTTPIVVCSRIKYLLDEMFKETLGQRRERIRSFQENLVKELSKVDHHLYYINGQKLMGEEYYEYTVDNIHPNDLGFMQIANSMEKEIKEIFKKEEKENGKVNR